MSDVDPWGDSDPEDIFGRKEVKKMTTPFEIKKEELEDPYRMIKVDLSSLLNTHVEAMTQAQICRAYRELFCEDLNDKAKTKGLSLGQLFEAISDTITPLKGPNGETLYMAARSDKTKDIRSQIVRQNREVKKANNARRFSAYGYAAKLPSNLVSKAAIPNQSRSVNNNTKKPGTIPMSSLTGGPKSDQRCCLIVKMIRDNGTFHQRSDRTRIRITKLQQVYAEMLNNLPLWGSTKTEKEYADSMDSQEYGKYWQISSEKNYNPTSPEDEFMYFIDVAPEGEESKFLLPDFQSFSFPNKSLSGRPTLSNAAHRLIRNSLPSPDNSELPCDRLPETRADLTLRRRNSFLSSDADSRVYSRSDLYNLSNICALSDMVLDVLQRFPKLKRKRGCTHSTPKRALFSDSKIHDRTIPPPASKEDSTREQALSSIGNSLKEHGAGDSNGFLPSRVAVAADVSWLRNAPCVVDLNHCNYLSGTPMFFLPPASVLFGLRNGNEDSERIEAINSVLHNYYENKEWSVLECGPGVPCIARCFDDNVFSYVRAVIVESEGDDTYECVCMDITATINVAASEIGPLPNCFSVEALPPSLFVARLRGVAAMSKECQISLLNLVRGYFNTEDNVAKPMPSAVFGRVGPDCVVDWIDSGHQQWLSTIVLGQPEVCSTQDDLQTPTVDDAIRAVREMETEGEFEFTRLEWHDNEAAVLCIKDKIPIKPNVEGPPLPTDAKKDMSVNNDIDTDDNAPIDIDVGEISVKMQHVHIEPNHAPMQSDHRSLDPPGEKDNSAHFLTLFKNICKAGNNTFEKVLVTSALAFISCAEAKMPTERWAAVMDEINNHF